MMLDITHWDIAVFIVLILGGFIFGFIAGRFYDLIDKLHKILSTKVVRRRKKCP